MEVFESKRSSLSAPGQMSRRLKGQETRPMKGVVGFVAWVPGRVAGPLSAVERVGEITAGRKPGVEDRTLGCSHVLNWMRAGRAKKVKSQRAQRGGGSTRVLSPMSERTGWFCPWEGRMGAAEFRQNIQHRVSP